MSRTVWSRLSILALAIPLVSCFDTEATCPTCPRKDGASIVVALPLRGPVDSLHVNLDRGRDSVTVRRGGIATYGDLDPGTYLVRASRWYKTPGENRVYTLTDSVNVKLELGEQRTVTFHNGFPIISDASVGRRAPAPLAARPARPGWTGA